VLACVRTRRTLRPCTARFSLGYLSLLAAVLIGTGCARTSDSSERPDGARDARVTRHVDGDTLWLSGIDRVRLIGLDTPEVQPAAECYGREAAAFVRRVAPLGTRVRYRLGEERRDRYGRALAYVRLPDGRFLNRLLLLRGFGQPLTVRPNDEFEDEFRAAAGRARERGRGLWGRPGCARR
jgi:micrococcal nuclease